MEVEEKTGAARRRIEAGSASGRTRRAVAVTTRVEPQVGEGTVAAGVAMEVAAKEGVANWAGAQEEAAIREVVAMGPEVMAPL